MVAERCDAAVPILIDSLRRLASLYEPTSSWYDAADTFSSTSTNDTASRAGVVAGRDVGGAEDRVE